MQRILIVLTLLTLLAVPALGVSAQEPVQCASDYTVEAGDWLSTIAERMLGDVLAYPAIVEATNAQTDETYATIDDSDLIHPGWVLCIPGEGDSSMPDESSSAPATELTGVVWQWQQTMMADDTQLTPDNPTQYTVQFLPQGQVAAQADCNRATGQYLLDGRQLKIGPMAMTRAACPPESFSDEYAADLQRVNAYSIDDEGRLVLALPDGGLMVFATAPSETATLTGTVTYRERIALPDTAVVEVQLADISIADAPATIISEESIPTEGRQVPIPFELGYDPAQIDERFTYAVRATITDGDGTTLFRSTQVYTVLTRGAPTSNVEIVVEQA